jgi:putative oxidoreductase
MGFFTDTMYLPWIVASLVIVGEFFGSLGLIAGLLTRFTAASFMVIMQGEGYEYHLLVIGIGLALLMTGAGKWSGDRLITEKV